jgi:hypothetical protein
MKKKIILAGLLGGMVLLIWMIVVNGFLRFHSYINMKPIKNEQQVYEILKENIDEPGRYVCNPAITPEMRYPEDEPVFSILYGGVGHEAAGLTMLIGLVTLFLTPMIGAWMLSCTSKEFISSYPKKVLFFVALGILIALFSDVPKFGIGGYPGNDTLLIALSSIIVWTIVGFVIAWRIKPDMAQRKI